MAFSVQLKSVMLIKNKKNTVPEAYLYYVRDRGIPDGLADFISRILRGEKTMVTYDRNRNPITNGSHVMINGTGKTGKIIAIHADGLTPAQVRRNKTVEVEGTEGQFEPVELIRLGLH